MNETPDADKVAFIEAEANRFLNHVTDSYDRLRAEGTNVLQWLFGAVAGGLGLAGTLVQADYICLAVGFVAASAGAGVAVCRLVHDLKARDFQPPGNHASALYEISEGPLHQMRFREALGLDQRIESNRTAVSELADGVDRARRAFAWLPAWLIAGALGAAVVRALV